MSSLTRNVAHFFPAQSFSFQNQCHEVYYGWGRKRSGLKAVSLARKHAKKAILLEDSFIRSFGTGDHFPQLSLIEDDVGIYYDATTPSKLENLLASDDNLLAGRAERVHQLINKIVTHGLSKYNHAPELKTDVLRPNDTQRILVVDQTFGDMSLHYGGVTEQTFDDMLSAALTEHPTATIYIKTHPEVTSGRKAGYYSAPDSSHPAKDRIVLLRDMIQPMSLLQHIDHVYVATSTMGFEALLLGKTVTCFGVPWYAGWGVTDDRQRCVRRTKKRSVAELFAVAYLDYTRYIDPMTHQPNGQLEQVIDWLILQKTMASRCLGKRVAIDFPQWRRYNLHQLLSLYPKKVLFVHGAKSAQSKGLSAQDCLLCWGRDLPKGVQALADASGAKLLYIEDGFVRSVGIGSDLIRPLSVVFDAGGLYFDPRHVSDLEEILANAEFSEEELIEAQSVRAYMLEHGITKYNLEPRQLPNWNTQGKKVILVPGQVEDDASIRYGCTQVKTNLDLLKSARATNPDAFIVYKPHPDVMSGNRLGKVALESAQAYADTIETHLSVVSCISACDEVHTMTSLTGFDALLRGKHVVVYGQPFYAGWGLTQDVLTTGIALDRRKRRLTLDELVAGAMLRYPIYWDWELKGYTTCMSVLRRIVETRTALEHSGELERLRTGKGNRLLRKIKTLIFAYFCR